MLKKKLLMHLKKGIFPYVDGFQVEKETDKEERDEEMDTTIIPKLESEESAAERRNQQRNGKNILT